MKMKINKGAIGQGVQVTVGGIGAKLVKNLAGKMIKNDKVRALAPFAVGLLLAGNKKTQLFGFGMMAVGGSDFAGTVVPALAGIEDMDLGDVFPQLSGGGDDEMSGPLNDADDMNGDDDMSGPLNDDLSGPDDNYPGY